MRKYIQSTWHAVVLLKYYFLSFKYLQGYVISQHEFRQVILFLLDTTDTTILLSFIKIKRIEEKIKTKEIQKQMKKKKDVYGLTKAHLVLDSRI